MIPKGTHRCWPRHLHFDRICNLPLAPDAPFALKRRLPKQADGNSEVGITNNRGRVRVVAMDLGQIEFGYRRGAFASISFAIDFNCTLKIPRTAHLMGCVSDAACHGQSHAYDRRVHAICDHVCSGGDHAFDDTGAVAHGRTGLFRGVASGVAEGASSRIFGALLCDGPRQPLGTCVPNSL